MQLNPAAKVYLADLVAKPVKAKLCVRVMRKWNFDGNKPGADVLLVGLVLADEKGNSMYGQILRRDVQAKADEIHPGKTYTLTNFNVRTSKPEYVPFSRQFMIELNSFTIIKEVEDPPETFPAYVYSLTSFSEIDPVTSSKKFVDVLGILTSVGSPEVKTLKDETTGIMREVKIKNLSNQELRVTLWGSQAIEFDVNRVSTTDPVQSVVILFVGCLPRSMNLVPYVTGGSACAWYFNPTIEEAGPLYNSLKHNPVPIYQAPSTTPIDQEAIKPLVPEHQNLLHINDIQPFAFLDQGFKCTVTVTGIAQDKRWSYIGCKRCKKSRNEETTPFKCTKCRYTQAGPLYNFNFLAADETSEARFLAYDDEARQMIRRNVETLVKMYGTGPGVPQEISNVISKKFTIHVGLTTDSYERMDKRTYVIRRILIDHELQAHKEKQLLLLKSTTTTTPAKPILPLVPASTSNELQGTSVDKSMTATPLPNESHTKTPTTDQQHTPPPPVEGDYTPEHGEDSGKPEHATALVPRKLFADADSTKKDDAKAVGPNKKDPTNDGAKLLSTRTIPDGAGSSATKDNI